ncbi:hypothetical protein CFC21_025382 [Triticum aestivum]|uniref:F-box domain-containing protein n=2 Tax=Triticum aestivum TaxID=4565 RepID=A0A3B6CCU9_WHEAT|nr:hypothetical protein CFC21_025382 [Triticum aestivum]
MASGADRISALPEDILHHVLRLLPAHEVVRTCLLARHWRGVWRSVPTLRFTGAKGWGSADMFAQFVDHLLHLRYEGDGPPLDSCDFDFDSDGFMLLPAKEWHASTWLWKALPRVRALRLRLRIVDEQEALPLSYMHLFSQHLTRLELVGVSFNNSVADFSGCPALVELSMDTCDVFMKQLLSPSLKHLRIARCYISDRYRILISLRALWCLTSIVLINALRIGLIVVVLGEEIFVMVVIIIMEILDMGLIMTATTASFSKVYQKPQTWSCQLILLWDLKWCPTFTKLKTLLLNDWCLAADHNALICFLQHSPILEKLTLQLSEGPSYVTEAEGIYKPLGQSVASNCLKIVEIECANVDKKVSILFALVSAKTRGTNIWTVLRFRSL